MVNDIDVAEEKILAVGFTVAREHRLKDDRYYKRKLPNMEGEPYQEGCLQNAGMS